MTTNPGLKKIIAEIAERISKGYHPKKVILFGSYACGEPTEDSDIDLLIVKNTEKKPLDRWIEVKKLLRDISQTVPVSPLVYTEKEIEQRLAMKDFFIAEIFETGEVLYG